jgi:heme-degrading monooxygenase HmoA
MFQILWQFDTTEDQAPAFAEAYGPEGVWVSFFQHADGYQGTELFRRTDAPPCFLTLDRWESRAAYEAFRRAHAADYAALDTACEKLTVRETFLAAWDG